MKYTKIITSLIAAAAFVFSSSLMAADEEKKAEAKTPITLQVSDLTDEQKTDLEAALKDRQSKVKAAGKNRAKRTAAFKGFTAKLKEIYTEEQFKEFEALSKKAQQSSKKGKRKGKKGKGKKK